VGPEYSPLGLTLLLKVLPAPPHPLPPGNFVSKHL
jgi:hypothetical protein